MENQADNLEYQPEPEQQPELQEQEQAQELEQEPEQEQEQQEPSYEEVEIDGKIYQVDSAIKPFILRQADYTKKTMALAEERKAVETELNAHKESVKLYNENFDSIAKLKSLDDAVKQYEQIDWHQLSNNDPVQWQQLWSNYNQLQQQRNSLGSEIQTKIQQSRFEEQQRLAKLRETHTATLLKEVPGWGTEKEKQIKDFAISHYGAKADEVEAISDPIVLRILHDAYIGKQLMAAKKTDVKTQIKPAAQIKSSSSGSNQKISSMNMEEYMKARKR